MRKVVALVVGLVVLACAACETPGGAPPRGSETAPAESGSPTPTPDTAAQVAARVGAMSLREKVGQLFVPTFSSAADGRAKIRDHHVGGLIYFPGNLRTPEQTARLSNELQAASRTPLLLGIDEEQGLVTRAPYLTPFPGNMALGATGRPADARLAARVTGTELRAVGVNVNYAPVADVNTNPANPVIGVRSFGSDPALVSRMIGPAVTGYQEAGVAATAKHFPGHGDASVDSHTGLPVIQRTRAEWERLDAPPFRAAIAAGVDSIMTAHIVLPKLDRSGDPSTLSRTVLTGLLRGELGFRGVIVTDSLLMAGVREKYGDASVPVRALRAGADQLLMPPDLPAAVNGVLTAVRDGRLTEARIDESVTRILTMKERRGLFRDARSDPARATSVVGSAEHRKVAREVAERAVTVVRDRGGTLPLRGRRVHVTGPQAETLVTALRRAGVNTVGSAAAADVTVATTRGARPAGSPGVVVALGAPYALNGTTSAAAVAAYSARPVAVRAVAAVLAGTVRPSGRLPVPAGGQAAGHGVTRG